MALPQEESEGFRIIGYRFLVGGIVSIVIGFVSKYYYILYNYGRFYWNQFPFRRGGKMLAGIQIGINRSCILKYYDHVKFL